MELALLLLAAVIWLLWQRRRIGRLFQRSLALAREVVKPQQTATQQAFGQTVALLAQEELTGLRIEGGVRDLVPVPAPATTDQSPFQPLADMLAALDRHSVATAGMEQVLLNVLSMPHVVDQVALYWYAGEIPAHLHEAAKNVLFYVESGHLGQDVVQTAGEVVKAVLHDTFADPHGLVDLLKRAADGAEHGHLVLGVASHFFNQEASIQIGLHGLHGLVEHMSQHAETIAAGHHLLDAGVALGHADALSGMHVHFPWLTAVISGRREFDLLMRGDTTATNVAEHMILDVGGVFLGGAAGHAVGAAIGTVVFPGVGTAVGGVLGGVVTAMAARAGTNHVKERKLHEAEAKWKEVAANAQRQLTDDSNAAVGRVRQSALSTRAAYLAQIGTAPRLDTPAATPLVAAVTQVRTQALAYVTDVQARSARARRLTGDGFGARLARGFRRVPEGTVESLNTIDAAAKRLMALVPDEATTRSRPLEALRQLAVLQLPLASGGRAARRYERSLKRATKPLGDVVPGHRRRLTEWSQNAAAAYKQVTTTLGEELTREVEALRGTYDTLQGQVKAAYADVEREEIALGRGHGQGRAHAH